MSERWPERRHAELVFYFCVDFGRRGFACFGNGCDYGSYAVKYNTVSFFHVALYFPLHRACCTSLRFVFAVWVGHVACLFFAPSCIDFYSLSSFTVYCLLHLVYCTPSRTPF